MKIGIDISQTAFRGSGVDRYTRNLIDALLTYDTKNEYVFFYSSLRIPLDPEIKKSIKKPHTVRTFKMPPTLLSFMWNTLHLFPIQTFIGDVDVFMSSDWTQPPTKHAKTITTIHDMVVYRYPETAHPKTKVDAGRLQISANIVAQQKKRHMRVKKDVELILADSAHTKKDIQEFLDITPSRIELLYPAVEVQKSTLPWKTIKERYNLDNPYMLTVGKREPRKNIDRLIEAFQQSEIKDFDLVIVGGKGWDLEIEHIEHVHILDYVPDEDLAGLYEHAEFFVFPSLYEGFGYPVVEAMGYGCPVATSQSSSLAEIAHDAAELFDPENTASITKSLIKLHTGAKFREALTKKGAVRYRHFSKELFAKNFVRIVQTLTYDNRR